jgi:hypothetical protein
MEGIPDKEETRNEEENECNKNRANDDPQTHHSGRTRHSTAAAATLSTTTPTAVEMLIEF